MIDWVSALRPCVGECVFVRGGGYAVSDSTLSTCDCQLA